MTKNFNIEEMKDGVHDARRALEQERDELRERVERSDALLTVLDGVDELLAENERLRTEYDGVCEQLQQEKELRMKLEMQLQEVTKLSASVAGKTSQDGLLKALRVFVNTSKRKRLEKRMLVKEIVMELVVANGIVLPEDMAATIASLDDEQVEPKVFNVTGNYNDIHDNKNVGMK